MTNEMKLCREAIWKPLPHMNGYEVSDQGDVRLHGKPVKQYNDRGYRIITVKGKNHLVHRMAAKAFGLSTDKFIDHIDGNRANNFLSNLRPASNAENIAYAYGRNPVHRGIYKRESGKYQVRAFQKKERGQIAHTSGTYSTIEEAVAAAKKLRDNLEIE